MLAYNPFQNHGKTISTVFVLLAIIIVGHLIYDRSKKEDTWPCSYKSPAELMSEYPEMKKVWDDYSYQVNQHIAEYDIANIRLDLAFNNGEIDLTEYINRQEKLSDKSFERDFQLIAWLSAQCAEVTGTELQEQQR